jgi:hypothetical protein
MSNRKSQHAKGPCYLAGAFIINYRTGAVQWARSSTGCTRTLLGQLPFAVQLASLHAHYRTG